MNSKQKLRARAVLILIIAAAISLAGSLYWTQIVKGPSYAARADQQYVKPAATIFDRGSIFFQSKDGTRAAAATVASGYLVYINPSLISDSSQDFQLVSQYLTTLSQPDFMAKAAKPGDHYEELADHVDDATTQSIRSLALAGVNVAPESWRSYPDGPVASHDLGVVGESADSGVEGRYGLERTYQDILNRPGIEPSINVFAQLFSGVHDSVFGSSQHEGDIVTTIEPIVEAYVEKVMQETSVQWKPDEIGAIVMDPQTGEIVAMNSLPTFDPNDTSDVKDVGVLSNPLVEHVYEMGSIMKPLTMATALDSGAEQPDSLYKDTGCMVLDTKKICNFDGVARGIIPMQQILSQSLNVGAATIALKTDSDFGKGTVAKYFASYGLGSTTGIDQPNEATGILGNLKAGQDIAVATAAYGQGIAVSPIEMVRALSILANGGYLVTPHLVKEIDYTDGTSKTISPPRGPQVLPASTTAIVTRMLVNVVDQTMVPARPETLVPHYSIASKTGTAQIPDHVNGGYYSDRYLHSFFTYFPASDPKYIVFMYQIYPKGAEYASATLTDPVFDITKFLINYYNIPPDR